MISLKEIFIKKLQKLNANQIVAAIIAIILVASIPIILFIIGVRYIYFGDLSGFPYFFDFLKFISGWIAAAIIFYLKGK